MNMTPSDLEYYLKTYTTTCTFVGSLNLPGGDAWDGWKQRLFLDEHSH
jgi:hypothetical protein